MPKTKKEAVKKATKAKKVVKKTIKKVAKKATKKKVVKKTAKNTVRKKKEARPLVYSLNETSFWVADGQILNNLTALRDALDGMSKDIYIYHAAGRKNDFANWVEVVLCDGRCAKDLRKAKSKSSARTTVVKHLKSYAL